MSGCAPSTRPNVITEDLGESTRSSVLCANMLAWSMLRSCLCMLRLQSRYLTTCHGYVYDVSIAACKDIGAKVCRSNGTLNFTGLELMIYAWVVHSVNEVADPH